MKFIQLFLLIIISVNHIFAQDYEIDSIAWKGKNIEVYRGHYSYKLKDQKYYKRANRLLSDIIKLNNNISANKNVDEFIDKNNIGSFEVDDISEEKKIISILEDSNLFEFVHPITVSRPLLIPNDSYLSNQYPITKACLNHAWEITTGSSNIKIGVLDSGIPIQNEYLSHSDLNSNRYILSGDYTGDGTGLKDELGHGTHVLGILGAISNNDNGIAGTNWNSELYIYKVFNRISQGSALWFYQAVINAVDMGCKIINYSGGGASDPLYEQAIIYARSNNVLVVAGSGNQPNANVLYPGALASLYDNVVCVCGTNSSDKVTGHSTNGSQVTLSAPSEGVYSTTPNYGVYLPIALNYDYMNGTSMATPYVSGVASLVLSQNPSLSAAQLKQKLIQAADDIQDWDYDAGIGWDQYTGYGRINAFKAVSDISYKYTFHNSPTGKSGFSTGDFMSVYTLSGYYVGRITISNNMIPADGIFRWNGFLDNGKYNLAPGEYFGLKNGTGSNLEIILVEDHTSPVGSDLSFINNSRIKININEYYNVVWVSAFIFNSNGTFLRKDFQNIISNCGSNKNFDLNAPLSPGQTIKIFIIDNAGNVNSISSEFISQPTISSLTQSPDPICQGSHGYVYCNLSQGNGNLSYSWTAADLPSGAYITPMGNRCKVTYPNTAKSSDGNSEKIMAPVNEITCIVTNSAGSDTESRSVYFDNDCGSQCPTLAFEHNGKIVNDNPILTKSVSSKTDVTDYYLVQQEVAKTDKKIKLLIHEPAAEHTYLDQVELMEVKVNPNEYVSVSEEGEIVNYKLSRERITFSLSGKEDIGSLLSLNDDDKAQFIAGDSLIIYSDQISTQTKDDLYFVMDGEGPIYKAKQPEF